MAFWLAKDGQGPTAVARDSAAHRWQGGQHSDLSGQQTLELGHITPLSGFKVEIAIGKVNLRGLLYSGKQDTGCAGTVTAGEGWPGKQNPLLWEEWFYHLSV